MSRMAAPSGDVTTPILRGKAGNPRFRCSSNSPFLGQSFAKLFERELERAQAVRL